MQKPRGKNCIIEPKRYSVDFSINLTFHLDYLVMNYSTHTHTHINEGHTISFHTFFVQAFKIVVDS